MMPVRQMALMYMVIAVILAGGCVLAPAGQIRLLDLADGQILTADQALKRLEGIRIILVGEHHNSAVHHEAQLQIIKVLHQAGRKVAIGMEMFRRDSQADLDRWTSGNISAERFKPVFKDNWNYAWDLYRPIFEYARREKLPMVGLNVPGAITAQVAFHGFESLSTDQKNGLEGITCDVTAEYRDFIQRAYGVHAHGRMDFGRFCEAQLVWDTAMAMYAIDYLRQSVDTVLVILAGSGHARKMGIPSRIAKTSKLPAAVLLPETKGVFDAGHTTVQDADYIILNQ